MVSGHSTFWPVGTVGAFHACLCLIVYATEIQQHSGTGIATPHFRAGGAYGQFFIGD